MYQNWYKVILLSETKYMMYSSGKQKWMDVPYSNTRSKGLFDLNVAELTAHYNSKPSGVWFDRSLLLWLVIRYTLWKPNTDRGAEWLGARGWHCACAICLVSKRAFCKTFEGSALLSKSKIDEKQHHPFFPVRRAVTTEPQSHPALERDDEILREPREREAEPSQTAVGTQHSSAWHGVLKTRR